MSDTETRWHTADRPDLRTGVWTRLGDHRVLGDQATEAVLGTLAERTRSAAQAQGYSVGWSEGHQAGLRRAAAEASVVAEATALREEARAAEHDAAVAALTAAAAALSDTIAEVAAHVGDQATDLAFELTRVLVGQELAISEDPGAGVVARVLAVLPQGPVSTVRLHPTAAASTAVARLAEYGVDVVADAGLDHHDAVIETATTAIDLRISEALDRLREVLR
ncbi:FliH/SctL family protein [Nocardioides sp. CN2-186]|uniref:FliH/SctL family protein n=1 Tax=Nocardioides tweenelious TaxID=3156607 RepID=UPI0032B3C604